jgi:hypothetical protein
MFSVRPTLQGGGVGKAMPAEAERIARNDWKLPAMRMTVIDIRAELIAFTSAAVPRTGVLKLFCMATSASACPGATTCVSRY